MADEDTHGNPITAANLEIGHVYSGEIDDCCVQGSVFLGRYKGENDYGREFANGVIYSDMGILYKEVSYEER